MTEAEQRIDEFILSEKLISANDKLLVAVSGGLDSMFLLTYLFERKYNIAVAHCNFSLRGDESDGDQGFVEEFSEARNLKLFIRKFETSEFAVQNGISIQMAARDLRYQWFEELCQTEGYSRIVTAHHKTDNAETILLNMIRGTGLKGLAGIPAAAGNKIRPLICVTREEIIHAVKSLNINYREDSSNKSDKYSRNRIRHHVLPEFEKINPGFEEIFRKNGMIISQANSFIEHYIGIIKNHVISHNGVDLVILISELQKCPEPKFVLYNIVNEYGFNSANVEDIYAALEGIPGKQFYSPSYRLTIDRGVIIIQNRGLEELSAFEITSETKMIITPHHTWHFEISEEPVEFSNNKDLVSFDHNKMKFPLTIRPWQQGDRIKPLGMQGHKKVSDILIDKKIPVTGKEKVWVVVSENEIVWVGGLVMSENFKTSPDTEKILSIRID